MGGSWPRRICWSKETEVVPDPESSADKQQQPHAPVRWGGVVPLELRALFPGKQVFVEKS